MIARFLAALLAAAALGAGPALAARPAVPTLAPSQLSPGQPAVVRTVFVGSAIDSFEAEIVGVVTGGRAEGDLILARATSPRVIRTGVAQGMSGSPVYVGGRLIGALSSGWAFSREPLFGITPIGEMLEVLDLPAREGAEGSSGPGGLDFPGRIRDLRFGAFTWSDEAPEPVPPAAVPAGLAPLGLPVSGPLRPAAAALLEPAFAAAGLRLTPGGRSREAGAGPPLEPGSAVAVDLLRGDLQLSAIGTVTYRDGDRVLIFGHPFFQAGDVRMPLSSATITTVVASDQVSFKLGQRGTEVGLATQDRRTAVAGRLGERARLMPIALEVAPAGQAVRRFRFESIEDRSLAPLLVVTALMNGVLESGGTSASQTLRWTLELHRPGSPPLRLADIASGDAPLGEMAAGIAAPLRFLLGNPFERCVLDSVRARIEILPRRSQWTLRSARLQAASVRPGGSARARCEIESWRGERREVEIALAVPEELPDGAYVLHFGGGDELSRYEAQRLPSRYRPTSLDDAWRRLAGARASNALYAALFAAAPEVTRRGQDYPELPISALALLASGTAAGDAGRRGNAARLDERRVTLDGPLRGEVLLPLRVERNAP